MFWKIFVEKAGNLLVTKHFSELLLFYVRLLRHFLQLFVFFDSFPFCSKNHTLITEKH